MITYNNEYEYEIVNFSSKTMNEKLGELYSSAYSVYEKFNIYVFSIFKKNYIINIKLQQ